MEHDDDILTAHHNPNETVSYRDFDRNRRRSSGRAHDPELNKVYKGVVKRLKDFGAFVALHGFDRDGLLHVSKIATHHVDQPSDLLTVNDELYVKVVRIEDGKYSLDMRHIRQSDGYDEESNNHTTGEDDRYRRRHSGGARDPELNRVYKGVVKRLKDFGAFVALHGFERDGLLHKSKIATYNIDQPGDVLAVNEEVYVKVVKIEDGKYSLDMRHIRQKDGFDEDPNNYTTTEDDRRRHYSEPDNHTPIELQAVLNVRCTRCNGDGHLAYECYARKGRELHINNRDKYALVDEPTFEERVSVHNSPDREHGHYQDDRDEKRRTGKSQDDSVKYNKYKDQDKDKKRRHISSDEDSGSSNSDRKKQKRHKDKRTHKDKDKDRHKHKHRHRSDN